MSLAQNLAALATAIARELKSRVTADHPGLAKAWVCFGMMDAKLVIHASCNVKHVARLAVGRYRVTFAAPMEDAHYCWLAFARNAGNSAFVKTAAARSTLETKTPRHVDVVCVNQFGVLADTTELNLIVYR